MARRFKDVTAADFPGVDPVKFEEWKKVRISSSRITIIGDLIILIIVFLPITGLYELGTTELLLCIVAMLIFNLVVNMKFRKLSRELNISMSDIRSALRRPW